MFYHICFIRPIYLPNMIHSYLSAWAVCGIFHFRSVKKLVTQVTFSFNDTLMTMNSLIFFIFILLLTTETYQHRGCIKTTTIVHQFACFTPILFWFTFIYSGGALVTLIQVHIHTCKHSHWAAPLEWLVVGGLSISDQYLRSHYSF